jgi:hypothetical protein
MRQNSQITPSQKSRSASRKPTVKMQSQHPPQQERFTQPLPTAVAHPDLQMVQDYVNTLVDPKVHMSRIPDGESRKTALIRSTLEVPIYANFSGAPDDGRFAAVAQPVLGKDGASPNTFKLALAKPGFSPNTTNWESPASYEQVVSGINVRQDRYLSQLTGTTSFFYGARDGVGSTALLPFGPTPLIDPKNYGSNLSLTTNGTNTFLTGGAGVYSVTLFFQLSDILYTLSGKAVANLTAEDTNTSDTGPSSITLMVNATGNWTMQISGSFDPGFAHLVVSPAVTIDDAPWENDGAVAEIRPVAMSALFSSTLSDLTNGGIVSAAYLPSSTCAANWFTNATGNGVGQLQSWESLSPLGYNGRLRDGSYCYWSPEDLQDQIFRTPEASNSVPYPCLALAGQMFPGTSVTGDVLVGRLELVTIYEFTTNVPLWEQVRYVGSQALIDAANRMLCDHPHSMANETHREFILRVLRAVGRGAVSAGKFIYNNRDVIVPLLGKAAAAVL